MITKRKIKLIAKTIFKESLKNGQVDNIRVRTIVAKIIKLKPEGFLKILKGYKKLIGAQIAKEEISVESAIGLSKNQAKEILARTNAKKIHYKLNKDMVFGAKITHGDWIYDASLDAKLKQLTIND